MCRQVVSEDDVDLDQEEPKKNFKSHIKINNNIIGKKSTCILSLSSTCNSLQVETVHGVTLDPEKQYDGCEPFDRHFPLRSDPVSHSNNTGTSTIRGVVNEQYRVNVLIVNIMKLKI